MMKKLDSKIISIFSAKNEWESAVDLLESHAIILLNENLDVVRANKTIELWGWDEVTKVQGKHILKLLKPAFENDLVDDWIEECSQLTPKENVNWVSNNYKTGKTYHFTFYRKNGVDIYEQNNNSRSVMLISDITNISNITDEQKLNAQNNTLDSYTNTADESDLVRLSAYRLHQLTNRLINAQENERNRISRELHDGLGQILSALKYQVESAVIESEKSIQPIENNKNLTDILKNVTFALSELRRISTNLRTSVLEDLGLLMTLKLFVSEYNKVYTDLNLDLYISLEESEVPEKNKSIIYRIVQESINNTVKHSNAKNIFIRLLKSKKGILLRIRDDGGGFDLMKVKQNKKSGLGLKTMEERAENSGASFKMNSNYLSGTMIQVLWENT